MPASRARPARTRSVCRDPGRAGRFGRGDVEIAGPLAADDGGDEHGVAETADGAEFGDALEGSDEDRFEVSRPADSRWRHPPYRHPPYVRPTAARCHARRPWPPPHVAARLGRGFEPPDPGRTAPLRDSRRTEPLRSGPRPSRPRTPTAAAATRAGSVRPQVPAARSRPGPPHCAIRAGPSHCDPGRRRVERAVPRTPTAAAATRAGSIRPRVPAARSKPDRPTARFAPVRAGAIPAGAGSSQRVEPARRASASSQPRRGQADRGRARDLALAIEAERPASHARVVQSRSRRRTRHVRAVTFGPSRLQCTRLGE